MTGQTGGAQTWGDVGQVISVLGGNADVFSLLNGRIDTSGGAYALIAGYGSLTRAEPGGTTSTRTPWTAAEISFERTQQSGILSASLVRDGETGDYRVIDSVNSCAGPHRRQPGRLRGAGVRPPTTYAQKWLTKQTGVFITPTTAQQAAMNYITGYAPGQKWTATDQACANAPDPVRGTYCEVAGVSTLYDHLHDDISFDPGDGQATATPRMTSPPLRRRCWRRRRSSTGCEPRSATTSRCSTRTRT